LHNKSDRHADSAFNTLTAFCCRNHDWRNDGDYGKHRKKVTTSKEDYLKAIWSLSERHTETALETGTTDLSAMLGVSPPAVSKMLKQMEQQALIARTPYQVVSLTRKAARRAHNRAPPPASRMFSGAGAEI